MKTNFKFTNSRCLLATVLLAVASPVEANEPSLPDDTNPALLYWREFATLPDLDQELFARISQQSDIDEEFRNFTSRYDETFRRLGKIRRFTASCNWGDDLDEGPELLLTYLAKARDIARITRLRTRTHLAEGRESAAVNELLSLYTLSGHVAESPILINILVHYAMDKIGAAAIAENLGQFSKNSLVRLKAGLINAPRGKRIAESIDTEKRFMAGWFRDRLTQIQTENTGNSKASKAAAEILLRSLFSFDGKEDVWKTFAEFGASDVASLIDMIDQSNADYDQLEKLCRKPNTELMAAVEAFEKETMTSKNPIRRLIFPSISKAMSRELGNQIINAMVLTAIDIQLEGNGALDRSKDPIGGAAFSRLPFNHNGEPFGFILESELPSNRDNRHLFLLKSLPNVQPSGPDIGVRD